MITLDTPSLAELPRLSAHELDALDFGVVQVDDAGLIRQYNRYESEMAGVAPAEAIGRNFFTEVAPCTNNNLLYGRFKKGLAAGEPLDFQLAYTFTYKMRPTNVQIRVFRDAASQTNWIAVRKR